MKHAFFSVSSLSSCAWLALALNLSAGDTKSKEPVATPVAAGPTLLQTLAESPIPKAVFVIPTSAAQGRNPFFPNSTAFSPQPIRPATNAPVEAVLVLQGINGPPKRMAIVNGKTFEKDEEGEVRLPSGSKILVKCLEVGDNSAVFLVAGQRRELKMRAD